MKNGNTERRSKAKKETAKRQELVIYEFLLISIGQPHDFLIRLFHSITCKQEQDQNMYTVYKTSIYHQKIKKNTGKPVE